MTVRELPSAAAWSRRGLEGIARTKFQRVLAAMICNECEKWNKLAPSIFISWHCSKSIIIHPHHSTSSYVQSGHVRSCPITFLHLYHPLSWCYAQSPIKRCQTQSFRSFVRTQKSLSMPPVDVELLPARTPPNFELPHDWEALKEKLLKLYLEKTCHVVMCSHGHAGHDRPCVLHYDPMWSFHVLWQSLA